MGLGNPGPEYQDTRHNLGFRILDTLFGRVRGASWVRQGVRWQAEGTLAGQPVMLVKPGTFMNRSGTAVAALAAETPFTPDELLVCYDDLALPLGRLRIRPAGSHGGHNGMRSIIAKLGSEAFPRLRVGIAPEAEVVEDGSAFVLDVFRRRERPVIDEAVVRAAEAAECAGVDGVLAAMNRFNPEPA
ncbi:MAG: aminoacyl-tRNA hydrolase [Gemmatimonadota bacterium]